MSQRVKDGTLKPITDPLTGRRVLDVEASDAAWDRNTDPSKVIGAAAAAGVSPEDASGFDYTAARAKREHFKAAQEEVAYRTKMGELVLAADVKRQAFEDGRAIRQAVMGVPDRLSPQLAAESDTNRIHALLAAELARALQALDSLPAPEDDLGEPLL